MPGSPSGRREHALAVRMERNLVEHACHLHRGPTGRSVSGTRELWVADSGFGEDTFNIVAGARFPVRAADARVAATVAALRATGRPFSWWVGPASEPADLSGRLLAAGLPLAGSERAMRVALAGLPRPAPREGLSVRRVNTPELLASYASVVAANWSPPSDAVTRFYAGSRAWLLRAGSPSLCFLGEVAGEPVATAEVFLYGGVAGVYNVCTLRTHRRRGHATALTLTALHAARVAGFRTAVLQASEEGAPVYARLGFEDCGEFREHAFLPAGGRG